MNEEAIMQNAVSLQNKFCEGFFTSKDTSSYFLGVNFAVAKVPKELFHDGSSVLDNIRAFDAAEVSAAHLGQINLMTVSSFCGPKGLIWGYDVCKTKKEDNEWGLPALKQNGRRVKIYSIRNISKAFQDLTGSVDKPAFPFLPGSHVPCAKKQIQIDGEGIIYSALGIGIPRNRQRNACLLMEDIGRLHIHSPEVCKRETVQKLTQSIIKIGENQKVEYEEIFVGIKELDVRPGEIGCALVAAPYFTLARDAFIEGKSLAGVTVGQWKRLVKHKFLYQSS